MQTIRLRISNKIFKNLMWFLGRFSKDELQVIQENQEFTSIQQYLEGELKNVENKSSSMYDLNELEERLESAITKHEA